MSQNAVLCGNGLTEEAIYFSIPSEKKVEKKKVLGTTIFSYYYSLFKNLFLQDLVKMGLSVNSLLLNPDF